jgi:outer membrane receptor protein involved in Fe transport
VGKPSNDYSSRKSRLSSISLKQGFDWGAVASYLWLSYHRSTIHAGTQLSPPGALAGISNPASDDPLHIVTDFEDYSEIRAQWHSDWAVNDYTSLQLGLELRHIDAPEAFARNNFDVSDWVNGIRPVRYYGTMLPTTLLQAKSKRNIVGLYGQYQRQLIDKIHLTLGLRYDEFSGIGSQLSPRLGLVHEINLYVFHSFKLLYGEAFRAPAEWELNLVNNPIVLGNPNLKPETVQSLDLIWVGKWTQTSFSLGYFENHFKNSIVQTGTGSGPLQYANENQDPIKGIEFELSREINEHWLLRATYTHITEKPDFSFRETDQLASFMANLQLGLWNANVIATYHGEREMSTGGTEANRITLDGEWLLFSKLLYNFTSDWLAFMQVKNLLDVDNPTPPFNSVLTEGIPDRGREISVGVTRWF